MLKNLYQITEVFITNNRVLVMKFKKQIYIKYYLIVLIQYGLY